MTKPKTLLECDIFVSGKYDNTLIIEPHQFHNKESLEEMKQRILNSVLAFDWLDDKGIELKFCMFGCTPYLHKKGTSDEHFDTNCKGNTKLTRFQKGDLKYD